MATQVQYHSATGRDFMAKAWAYLDEDDLLQASEKGWGAAAQAVKAVAEARGRRHKSHRDLFRAIDRLADETGDRQLRTLFHSASALHTNFYEGWMPRGLVADGLSQVEDLVKRLEALHDRPFQEEP